MTYLDFLRSTALMESHALRGWARAGKLPPPYRPVDVWSEWSRISKHSNATTKRKKLAA